MNRASALFALLSFVLLAGAGCSSHYDMQDLDAEGEVFLKEARLQQRAEHYSKASGLYGQANEKFEAAHVIAEERSNNTIGGHLRLKIAIVYSQQAECSRPDTDASGDWDRARELYQEAETWALRGNFLRMQRDMIVGEAECLRPDNNPQGSWEQAAQRYEKAVKISDEIEDEEGKGAALRAQAICLLEGPNLDRLTEPVKKLLVEANRLGDKRAAELLAETGERFCRHCSKAMPVEVRFCPKCGGDQVPKAKVEKQPPPNQPPPE